MYLTLSELATNSRRTREAGYPCFDRVKSFIADARQILCRVRGRWAICYLQEGEASIAARLHVRCVSVVWAVRSKAFAVHLELS